MALINQINNQASIVYNGQTITSNTAATLLLLAPTILKAVDKATAQINEILTYTITITNISLVALTNINFQDTLDKGLTFVDGSFTVNTTAQTPTIANNVLSYTIPNIAVAVPTVISFKCKIVGGNQ